MENLKNEKQERCTVCFKVKSVYQLTSMPLPWTQKTIRACINCRDQISIAVQDEIKLINSWNEDDKEEL